MQSSSCHCGSGTIHFDLCCPSPCIMYVNNSLIYNLCPLKKILCHPRLAIFTACLRFFEFILFFVAAPSSPPLNFVATPTDSRSIALRWDPPLPEDRNGPITSYLINVTVVETGEITEINTTLTTFRLLFLTPFTTYEFTIAASTEVGLGPFSETVSVLTPEDGNGH